MVQSPFIWVISNMTDEQFAKGFGAVPLHLGVISNLIWHKRPSHRKKRRFWRQRRCSPPRFAL